jgi:putative oxidoreductase
MNAIKQYGPVAGRILIAIIFIFAGFGKFTGLEGTAGYIASKGLPAAYALAIAAAIVEFGGGVLLAVGFKTRFAAAALALFTLAAALIFHNFWGVPADQAQNQMIHFLKNISMVGGLLYVIVYGSGPLSVDGADK